MSLMARPECNDPRPECFGRLDNGDCKVLESAYGVNKKCPFYKTMEQFTADAKKYESSLLKVKEGVR